MPVLQKKKPKKQKAPSLKAAIVQRILVLV
jgi:hypothetical protein